MVSTAPTPVATEAKKWRVYGYGGEEPWNGTRSYNLMSSQGTIIVASITA